MTRSNAHRRAELDAQLGRAKVLIPDERPARGWVRAIRDALGMSSTELAARMGVTQSWIPAMERNEVDGSIRLDTLRRAADALDCDVVYTLVPRTSLTKRSPGRRKHREWESHRSRRCDGFEPSNARSRLRSSNCVEARCTAPNRPPRPVGRSSHPSRSTDPASGTSMPALVGAAPPTADDVEHHLRRPPSRHCRQGPGVPRRARR